MRPLPTRAGGQTSPPTHAVLRLMAAMALLLGGIMAVGIGRGPEAEGASAPREPVGILLITEAPGADLGSLAPYRDDRDFRESLPSVRIVPRRPQHVTPDDIAAHDVVLVRWHLFRGDSGVAAAVYHALAAGKTVVLFGERIPASQVDRHFGTTLTGVFDKGVAPDHELQGVLLRRAGKGLVVGRASIDAPRGPDLGQVLRWVFLYLPGNVPPSIFQEHGTEIAEHPEYPTLNYWHGIYEAWHDESGYIKADFNMDMYLHLGEDLSDGDILFMEPRIQVRDGHYLQGNAWTLSQQATLFDLSDELKDWGPPSTESASYFSVNLGPPVPSVSWTFSVGSEVRLSVQADTVEDWVQWDWSKPWWNIIPVPFHTKPGVSWFSPGSFAFANTTTSVLVCKFTGPAGLTSCHWLSKSWALVHDYGPGSGDGGGGGGGGDGGGGGSEPPPPLPCNPDQTICATGGRR